MKYATLTLVLITLLSCEKKRVAAPRAHVLDEIKTVRIDIDIDQAKKIMDSRPEVVFLDVRTPEETAAGTIIGAKIADVKADDFDQQIDLLDPNQEYIVYCRSGRRSVKASNIMIEKGFAKVKNMKGGYNAWKEKY